MASKQRRKQPSPAPSPAPAAEARSNRGRWALIAVAAVAVVAGAGAFLLRGADPAETTASDPAREAPSAAASAVNDPAAAAPESAAPQFTSEDLAGLPMPPLPYVPQTAGPVDLMRQAYVFAARNPDVLSYVPCYCGCGMSDGHQSNVDCFVESRAPNGAVTEWDVHGMT